MVEFVEDIQKSGYQYLVEKFGKEKIKKDINGFIIRC